MPAIPAAIMAGGAIAGAVIKSKGAKGAAKTQARGATEVAGRATETSESIARDIRGAGDYARDLTLGASEGAATGVEGATGEANLLLKDVLERSTALTEPYRETGGGAITNLADLLAPEGEFSQKFSMDEFQADPGYAFRLAEGQKAIERSAAGRGALQSGSTLKALTKYSQGAASQEYQSAFDRFMEQRRTRYGMLSDLAGFGERAVGQQLTAEDMYGGRASGNIVRGAETAGAFRVGGASDAGRFVLGSQVDAGRLRMGGESIAGDAMIGAANARAAGKVGSANAWAGGIQGAGSSIAQYLTLRDLSKKPAKTKTAFV